LRFRETRGEGGPLGRRLRGKKLCHLPKAEGESEKTSSPGGKGGAIIQFHHGCCCAVQKNHPGGKGVRCQRRERERVFELPANGVHTNTSDREKKRLKGEEHVLSRSARRETHRPLRRDSPTHGIKLRGREELTTVKGSYEAGRNTTRSAIQAKGARRQGHRAPYKGEVRWIVRVKGGQSRSEGPSLSKECLLAYTRGGEETRSPGQEGKNHSRCLRGHLPEGEGKERVPADKKESVSPHQERGIHRNPRGGNLVGEGRRVFSH